MKSFSDWRIERRARKEARKLLGFILAELDKGVPVGDLFVYVVRRPVLWKQQGGFWYIELDDDLEPGQKLTLLSGRGGAKEDARVVERIGDGEYSVTFDVDGVE
jgi:hypothetical protein